MVDPVKVATSVSKIALKFRKPVLGCFMGVKDILRTIQETSQSIIPLYAFPESAARALNGLVRYARIKKQEYGEPTVFAVDREAAEKIFSPIRKENRTMLNLLELKDVLTAYGIPVAPMEFAKDLEEAVLKARKLGYPVVMKASLKNHEHKSDVGGVVLDLRTDTELIDSYAQLSARLAGHGLQKEWNGVYIQPMIRGGKEVIIGMTYDPTFGPLIMFGLGGVYVETMRDTVFRVIPISASEAHGMIHSIKGYPLLKGIRGEPGVDLDLLAEILQRISQLASDFHFIRELEINPFIASARKELNLAVDFRARLE
jgi:acetyltransferase